MLQFFIQIEKGFKSICFIFSDHNRIGYEFEEHFLMADFCDQTCIDLLKIVEILLAFWGNQQIQKYFLKSFIRPKFNKGINLRVVIGY